MPVVAADIETQLSFAKVAEPDVNTFMACATILSEYRRIIFA